MLEPYLATIQDVIWVKTKDPRIHTTVLRCDGGFVVLPVWTEPGTQFVTGPCYVKNLEIVIPGLPIDTQVYEVVPGDVRAVHHQRAAGGVRAILPDDEMERVHRRFRARPRPCPAGASVRSRNSSAERSGSRSGS